MTTSTSYRDGPDRPRATLRLAGVLEATGLREKIERNLDNACQIVREWVEDTPQWNPHRQQLIEIFFVIALARIKWNEVLEGVTDGEGV